MGCGVSKSLLKRLEDQDDKLKQIVEKNEILQIQIKELKDQKNKRKPTYIMEDREIDDLNIFITDIDKRFVNIQSHIEQLNCGISNLNQLQSPFQKKPLINPPGVIFEINEEEQWKNIEDIDNDLTIKAVEVHDISNIFIEIDLDKEIQMSKPELQIKSNFLNDLNSNFDVVLQKQQDPKVYIPKAPPSRQMNEIEVQETIKNILQDDGIKNTYDEIKSKMFKEKPLNLQQSNEITKQPSPLELDKDTKFFNKVAEEPERPKTQYVKTQAVAVPTGKTTQSSSQFYSNQNGAEIQKRIQGASNFTSKKETKKNSKKS